MERRASCETCEKRSPVHVHAARADPFSWQTCFHTTLLKFREAVIRKCIGIRRHFIHRVHTRLTEVVSEEERAKYGCVAKIEKNGIYSISPALEAAIQASV